MKEMWTCRRTYMAFVGIIALILISSELKLDTTNGIVAIVGFIAGSNAFQSAIESISKAISSKSQKNDTK